MYYMYSTRRSRSFKLERYKWDLYLVVRLQCHSISNWTFKNKI